MTTKHPFKIIFTPHPNKVLIKISKEQLENICSKIITRDDGTKARLFSEPEYEEGFDRRYQQNVSAGTVVAVGSNVKSVRPSDVVILDYLATNNIDILIGAVKGDKLICVNVDTTYHQNSAPPLLNGRRAWVKGDYDYLSPIYGVIRNGKMIAFDPYIFLVYRTNKIVKVLANGQVLETKEDLSEREVLSAPPGNAFRDGDVILVKEADLTDREVNHRKISVIFKNDIICKKEFLK